MRPLLVIWSWTLLLTTFKRGRLRGCQRKNSVYHGLPWIFQWKITILSHKEISHLFGPIQFFLDIICKTWYSLGFSCGIRNPGKIFLRGPESWALKPGIELKESGILLRIGIQNPSSTDKDWNHVSGIQNPKLSWIPFHGAINLFVNPYFNTILWSTDISRHC